MSRKTILIAEDDPSISIGLKDLLESEGYTAHCAHNGNQAVSMYRQTQPDCIILDIMMPEKNGYEVCSEIRKTDPVTPIIMLTAKSEEIDKVLGLEIGADDYITKPFSIRELTARVKAVIRRNINTIPLSAGTLEFGDVKIDLKNYSVKKGSETFRLSHRETELLKLLHTNKNSPLTRDYILESVWGVKYEGTTRTLDQHIAKLRGKIENDPAVPEYIITVHGIGYKGTF